MRLLQQLRVCEGFPYRSSQAILQEPNGFDCFKSEGCAKVFLLSFETILRTKETVTYPLLCVRETQASKNQMQG